MQFELDGAEVAGRRVKTLRVVEAVDVACNGVAEPTATYRTRDYGLLVGPDGARRVDEGEVVVSAEGHDLFLDLLSTVAAGR